MKSRSRLFTLISLVAMLTMLCAWPAAASPASPISPVDFREHFTAYLAWLDANTAQTLRAPGEGGTSLGLAQQVQAMNEEEFQALYDAFADPDAFVAIMEQVMAGVAAAPTAAAIAGPQSLAATALFPPEYPSGSTYAAWVATLPGLGLLADWDGDGSLANERCSFDGEAGIGIAAGTLEAAAIVGDVACNMIVVILGEGTNAPACIAAGVLHEAVLANAIVGEQCSSQDGNVDSAEIEACYENSKIIAGQVDALSAQLATHDSDMKGRLATHDTDMKGRLATHDTDIKNALSTHDTDIKNALATHDTDMKAALQAHHDAVIALLNANQAQNLKIEIEQQLSLTSGAKRLSYFYLPAAQGGLLELVQATVEEAIAANKALGIPIGYAESYLRTANGKFAAGAYKAAFDYYALAYLSVIK